MSFKRTLRNSLLNRLATASRSRLVLLVLAITTLPMAAVAGYPITGDIFFEPWNVTLARDGNFYGNVVVGAAQRGYMFSISPTGTLRRFGHFPHIGNPLLQTPAGSQPIGKPGVGQDGTVYGRTMLGGVFGGGVLFRVNPKGEYKVIHHLESYGFSNSGIVTTSAGAVLATENGDIFAGAAYEDVLCVANDGAYRTIALPEIVVSLVETADHRIIAGSYLPSSSVQVLPRGGLWRLGDNGEFELLGNFGGLPHTLIPLLDGGVLCLTNHALLQVSAQGEIATLHEFLLPFEGTSPTSLVLAQDGSYIGTTKEEGLDGGGVVFRFVPGINSYSVVEHLPNGGRTTGAARMWLKHFFPVVTKLAAGNHPPMATDDVVSAANLKSLRDGLPEADVPVLLNDRDIDRDSLSIVAISQPSHGTATLDFVAQKVTYNANSSTVENDSFTYTVVDGSGGTSIAHVIIRTNPQGQYEGLVNSVENPGTVLAGNLSLNVKANREFSGRLLLNGWTYRFVGRFNERNQYASILRLPAKRGRVPIQLHLRPQGSGWTVEASMKTYSASCTKK